MVRLLPACFILAAAAVAAENPRIVLVAGRPSHGPGAHEFNAGVLLLNKCLRQNGADTIVVKGGWPDDAATLEGARAIVFYMDGGERHPFLTGGRLEMLDRHMKKGVGLALLHYAVEAPKDNGGPQLLDWIGGYYERPYSQNPVNDAAMEQATPKHPISRGWKSFQARDEWYFKIRFQPGDKRVTPILTTMLPKDAPNRETVAWTVERKGGGRGFGFTGGHFHQNWGIEDQWRLVLNAILWTAKAPIPKDGASCHVTGEDLTRNLDEKPIRKEKH